MRILFWIVCLVSMAACQQSKVDSGSHLRQEEVYLPEEQEREEATTRFPAEGSMPQNSDAEGMGMDE